MTQGMEENGRAEKPKGDGGATQRLGTTGRCCHTLAGGTSWSGTRTHGAGTLRAFWTHSRPRTTQWDLGPWTQRRHHCCWMLPEAHSGGRYVGFSLFSTLPSPAGTSHRQTQLEDKWPRNLGKAASGHLAMQSNRRMRKEWEGKQAQSWQRLQLYEFLRSASPGWDVPTPASNPTTHPCWELQKSEEGFALQCDSSFNQS